MPEDAVIDYDFMSKITEAGYSRIPVTKSMNSGTGDITGKYLYPASDTVRVLPSFSETDVRIRGQVHFKKAIPNYI